MLALGGAAHAQTAHAQTLGTPMLQALGGLSVTPSGAGGFVGITAQNVGTLGVTRYGLWAVDARLSADIAPRQLFVNADALFATPAPFGAAYTGGGVHFRMGRPNDPAVFAAVLGGAEFVLSSSAALFAEGAVRFDGVSVTYTVRGGVTRAFY